MGGRRWLVLLALLAGAAPAVVVGLTARAGSGSAQTTPTVPLNDLNQLAAVTGYPTPAMAPVQHNPEPPLTATPRATCGPGSHPLAGEQGRVPASAINSPQAASGWTCNTTPIGHYAETGGFRTWRYVDQHGHVCAFYDTALPSPLNVIRVALGGSPGAAVLDMSDPAHPVKTDTLNALPMRFPHESLNLSPVRGLLAAEMGQGTTYPGLMAIYDVSQDCRHPALDATFLASRFGHESGFAPDGRTFYVAGGEGIAAVDVTDPKHPRTLWDGNEFAHGLNVSDDGNRLYDSDPIDGDLTILDVSQIQARRSHPAVSEVSRLQWDTVSIPQNTDPIQVDGHPYLLEFDEFGFRFNAAPPPDTVGAARIIDIADERHPRVVSNLRLEVNQPAAHAQADSDPSPLGSPQFTYSAHYCNVPREVDPEIAACSFINSGLRIFDIRDPLHPREVAYFIAPPKLGDTANTQAGDFAMSQPAFDAARREVWYTDAASGFWVLRLDRKVWPDATTLPALPPAGCAPASGRLTARALGPVALGQRRASIRARLARFSTHGRTRMDYICLTGTGLRIGYVGGRALLILTSNRRYSLDGVRPGASFASARGRLALHARAGIRIGVNTWYVLRGRTSNGVLKVRDGVVQEIGLADRRATSTRARAGRFLSSFG